MIRRSSLAVTAVLAAAALGAGCGGDSSTDTSSATTGASQTPTTTTNKAKAQTGAQVPSKVVAEYADIGTAIYQIGDNYGRASQEAANWSDGVASKYFAGLADTTRSVVRGLEKATPNAALEENRVAIIAGLKRMATDLDALAAAGKKKDTEGAKAAARRIKADAAEVNTPLNELAAKIGASE